MQYTLSSATVSRKTMVKKQIRLSQRDVVMLLCGQAKGMQVPAGAKVYVRIPGGGDWSNMDLDLSEDTMLIVEWEEEEQ